uniref:PHD-type domain-containing protein n=1 Tax=Dunaliella tertiolecta TaxID=3047 RepID=A0A7S3QRP8_DUNTE
MGTLKTIAPSPGLDAPSVFSLLPAEEAIGGRKAFHGHKELFTSDHEDVIHKNTILGKCNVHTLRNYESLQRISDNDYFARFSYKPASKEFEPDRVPVYCTCELPYNPDLPMIMCDQCEEWYHLKCLEDRNNKVELQQSFCCDQCKAKAKKARVE